MLTQLPDGKQIIEPVIEDRFQSADEALARLQEHQLFRPTHISRLYLPRHSTIIIEKTEQTYGVEIPPIGFRTTISKQLAITAIACINISILVFWLFLESRYQASNIYLAALLTNFYILIFVSLISGAGAFLFWFRWAFGHTKLKLNARRFQLRRSLRPWDPDRLIQGETQTITEIKLEKVRYLPLTVVAIIGTSSERTLSYRFGFLLTQQEKRWLVHELQTFLDAIQASRDKQTPNPSL